MSFPITPPAGWNRHSMLEWLDSMLGATVVRVKSVCRVYLDNNELFDSAGLDVPWSVASYDPDSWFGSDPDSTLQVPSGKSINYVFIQATLGFTPAATSERVFAFSQVNGGTGHPFRGISTMTNDGSTDNRYLSLGTIVAADSTDTVGILIDKDGTTDYTLLGGTGANSTTATFFGLEIG
jgi:hypothetical protein